MGDAARPRGPREQSRACALDWRRRVDPASRGRSWRDDPMTGDRQAILEGIAVPQSRRIDETRTLIAIGDPARERLVLQLLAENVEDGIPLRLVRRCLDAKDLLASVEAGELDAAIVSADLHGFGIGALRALARVRIPLVLWGVNRSGPEGLDTSRVTVLPRDVEL